MDTGGKFDSIVESELVHQQDKNVCILEMISLPLNMREISMY